jgi:hypothetical protein
MIIMIYLSDDGYLTYDVVLYDDDGNVVFCFSIIFFLKTLMTWWCLFVNMYYSIYVYNLISVIFTQH